MARCRGIASEHIAATVSLVRTATPRIRKTVVQSTMGWAIIHRLIMVYPTISTSIGIWLRIAMRGSSRLRRARMCARDTATTCPSTIANSDVYHTKRAPTIPMSGRKCALPKMSHPNPNGSEASRTSSWLRTRSDSRGNSSNGRLDTRSRSEQASRQMPGLLCPRS